MVVLVIEIGSGLTNAPALSRGMPVRWPALRKRDGRTTLRVGLDQVRTYRPYSNHCICPLFEN